MARKLEVQIVGDASSFQRALGQASKSGTGFGSKLAKIGKLAALGIGIAGAAAGAAGVKMVGLASDAEEVESKFKVIFGKTVPKLTKQINTFAKATGASRFELKEMVADLGALLKPIIGSTKEAGKMSLNVAKLATDLSSFNNVPVEEALLAIRSGLVGEAEPLRRFGVLLNEAAVKAEALRLGLVKENEELTESQKVQARYSLIMKQTTLAQGDAVRTSGSFANQLKRLKNGVRDAGTSIGKFLLPVATAVIGAFNDAIPAVQGFLDKMGKAKGFKAKFNIVWTGIKQQVADLFDLMRDALLGSSSRELLKLDSGKIIEWKTSKQEGLVKSIQDGLRGVDWASVGKQIGEGISKRVRITADFIATALTAMNAFIDSHLDEFAELGAKMMLSVISKLLDPAFWVRNWQLVLGVAVAVFPLGRLVKLGGQAARAILSPLLKLLPAGFRGIGGRAVDAILGVLGRLPGRVQSIIVAVVSGAIGTLGRLVGFLRGRVAGVLDRVPGWIKAAFRLSLFMAFVSGIQTGWAEIRKATASSVAAVRGQISRISGPISTVVGWLSRVYGWLVTLTSRPWEIVIKIPTPSLPERGGGVPFIPGIASGGDITRSGLAVVHRGERVIPAQVNRASGGGASRPIDVHVALNVDGQTLLRIVRRAESDYDHRNGGG